MTVTSGSRLGPYEIVTRIGAGGMGEVFEARDVRLSRKVAIKVLPHESSRDEKSRERFRREAQAISALSHPHICALHDVGREGETDFLVFEYLDGETLAERLAFQPLPLDEVIGYGAQMADALAEAHRHGIIHRDLKPSNVMITRSGAKLLDFGLAKAVAQFPDERAVTAQQQPLTTKGAFVGTFGYMPPEQLESRDSDARSDIFSLGTVLYEMATGRRPFEGTTTASLIGAVMKTEPAPLRDINPAVPAALDRAIRKCLRKDPEERWQSAKDLADELRWIGENAAAEPSRPIARRKIRLVLPIAALVAAIAAGIFVVRRPAAEAAGPPVIVMMDSTNPERIYSSITRANNQTNADDLTNLLRDLDVRLVKENTSAFWNREDQVVKERPALITIHRGAFSTAASALPDRATYDYAFQLGEKKVQSFIGYAGLANRRTKFIVYSRSWKEIGGWQGWVSEVENRFPHVRGRVVAIDVTGSSEPSFRDAQNGPRVRALVIDLLDLENQDR